MVLLDIDPKPMHPFIEGLNFIRRLKLDKHSARPILTEIEDWTPFMPFYALVLPGP